MIAQKNYDFSSMVVGFKTSSIASSTLVSISVRYPKFEHQEELKQLYIAAKNSIQDLLERIKLLGYQISHLYGDISKKKLQVVEDQFFQEKSKRSTEEKAMQLAYLSYLIPEQLDLETVLLLFGCTGEQGEILWSAPLGWTKFSGV